MWLLACLLLGIADGADAEARFRAIALAGQQAPGTESSFARFGLVTINESGEVAFDAAVGLDPSGLRFDTGIWGPTAGSALGLVAREGTPAPGTTSEQFSTFSVPVLGDDGRVAFVASLKDANGVPLPEWASGLWAQRDGLQPTLVAREGVPAPGSGDPGNVSFLALPLVDASGGVGFRGAVTGPPPPQSARLWMTSPAGVEVVAGAGDPAPGAAPWLSFSPLMPLRLAAGGDLYYLSGLDDGGGRFADEFALYRREADGSIDLLFRTGELVPALGGVVDFLEDTRFDERGNFATITALETSAPPERGVALFPNGADPVWLARPGDAPPGVLDGSVFGSFSSLQLGVGGTVAFTGRLHDPLGSPLPMNDRGIWAGDAGDVSLVLREGDAAPGLAGLEVSFLAGAAVNARGDLLFRAGLRGPGVDAGNDGVLYFASDTGHFVPLLREGQAFEVAPGDVRILLGFEVVSRPAQGLASFNARRQVAFEAVFTDGSAGVFLAEVPEPGTLLLVALGASGLAAVGRCSARRAVQA